VYYISNNWGVKQNVEKYRYNSACGAMDPGLRRDDNNQQPFLHIVFFVGKIGAWHRKKVYLDAHGRGSGI